MFQRLNHLFAPRSLVAAAAGALFGILSNLLSERFNGAWAIPFLTAVMLALGLAYLFFLLKPPRPDVTIGAPVTIRSPADRLRYARRGLVAFVSLYQPIKDPEFATLLPEEKARRIQTARQAAARLEYLPLNLEKSTLEPVIRAVLAHQPRLEHCWLIATCGPNGSDLFLPVLVKYLQEVYGLQCEFHHLEYTLSFGGDDGEVVKKTRDLVEEIYADAAGDYGLKAGDLIADLTSAPRSMALGMTLACMDGQRDVQYMGSEYGPNGVPCGELRPILFHFEAVRTAD